MEGKGNIRVFFKQVWTAIAGIELSPDEQWEYEASMQKRLIFNLRFFTIAVLSVFLVFSIIDYYRNVDDLVYYKIMLVRFVLIGFYIIPFLIYSFIINSSKKPHLLLTLNVAGYIVYFLVQSIISKDYTLLLFHNTLAIFLLNICIYFILRIRFINSIFLSILILFTINVEFYFMIAGKNTSFSYSDLNFWFIVTTIVAALTAKSIENIQKKSFKTNTDLKNANQAKYKLFSMVSHDLKNMISAQYTIADCLKDDHYKWNEADRNRMITILHNSSQDVLDLFEDLMSWIKTQIEVLKPEMQNIDVDLFHQSVLNQMLPAAENKNIQLSFQTDSTNEIQSDPHILGLIMRNLLGNAIKYSNSDSTITIKNSAKDGFVEYQIIDTGVGMSDQQLQQILNFQTIESATGTRGEKGTGLGLLLTKELLNILNGSLQIDSTPEIGTSVTFKLPLNQINTLTNQVKEKRFNRWLLN